MFKNFFVYINSLLIFTALIAALNFNLVFAQDIISDCKFTAKVYNNNTLQKSTVSGNTTSVNISKVDYVRLELNLKGGSCNGGKINGYFMAEEDGKVVMQNSATTGWYKKNVDSDNFKDNIAIGAPDGKYTYTFDVTENSGTIGSYKVVVGYNFASFTPTGGAATPSSSNGSTSGGSTSSLGGDLEAGIGTKAKSGTEIQAGLGISTPPGFNYDKKMGDFFNPLEYDSVPELIARLTQILLALAGMLALLFLVYGGFTMVLNSGSPAAYSKGKDIVQWAILGLLLCLFSFSIVAIVQRLIT